MSDKEKILTEENIQTEQAEQSAPAEKKKRIRRRDMTPEQKKKRTIRDLIITGIVFGVVGLLFACFAISAAVGLSGNYKRVEAIETVDSRFTKVESFNYQTAAENTVGFDDETGAWTFVTDGDFTVLQLTDIHIGAGAFSIQKDSWAISAVAEVVKANRPDLVIITGDIAYPVPFQAGTFNNLKEAELFATLMEKLGVFWAITFGNHDTESYSMYDRKEIADFYMQERWTKCLFMAGDEDVDGYGNYVINVQNTSGLLTQSIYLVDSHSYTDGDIFGIAWKYDKIHDNQIDWYRGSVAKMNAINIARGAAEGSVVKSIMFFHIPLVEYRLAWEEFKNNGYKNTDNVKYYYGKAGEKGEQVYSGKEGCDLFDVMLELGSTKGIFTGHDHLNNFSVDYKGIRLTYGLSIDYLAYFGIAKQVEQRGGTLITIKPDGSFDVDPRPMVGDSNEYLFEYHRQV
ncbi:MAG: hypothetical protein GX891_02370 [Clostridiales bacterium]|nr:hypothetical protein [Clostridiales bacterium]